MKGRPASSRVSTQENFIITVSWPYLPAGEEREQNETLIDFFFIPVPLGGHPGLRNVACLQHLPHGLWHQAELQVPWRRYAKVASLSRIDKST